MPPRPFIYFFSSSQPLSALKTQSSPVASSSSSTQAMRRRNQTPTTSLWATKMGQALRREWGVPSVSSPTPWKVRPHPGADSVHQLFEPNQGGWVGRGCSACARGCHTSPAPCKGRLWVQGLHVGLIYSSGVQARYFIPFHKGAAQRKLFNFSCKRMGLQLITAVFGVNQELLSSFPRAPILILAKSATGSAVPGS